MPKRDDLHKILVIGAGPVIVGRGIEFDYAGVCACKVLKDAGYEVVVVNSNPTTVMTDLDAADRIYLEPLTVANLEKIIMIETPDALLLNYGGQTAFDLGRYLVKSGILAQYGVNLIGITGMALNGAQSYQYYQEKLIAAQIKTPAGYMIKDVKEGMKLGLELGFPIALRSFDAPEGIGTFIAYNQEELEVLFQIELTKAPDRQVILEESLLGWKEFAVEVLGDSSGKYLVAGSSEQLEPVGVHSGDSIAVTPVQTLPVVEYQKMAAICENTARVIQLTGSINIQVAQNPGNGDFYVFKINHGFTKSTAMIAKATGLPIVDIATKLMLGYHLAELGLTSWQCHTNYVAVRLPRFEFEKFPTADPVLNTTMKSTGEVMAIGSNFKAAFQKGLRSLEIGSQGFGADGKDPADPELTFADIKGKLANPNPESFHYIRYALKSGSSIAELNDLTKIDRYFLKELAELVSLEKNLTTYALYNLSSEVFLKAKQWGFSDKQLADLLRTSEDQVREARRKIGINPVFATIPLHETRVGEAKIHAGFYSFYRLTESDKTSSNDLPGSGPGAPAKMMIIGPGPNRIDRSGEFDYSVVHATRALQKMGLETIVIHNNPGGLATDPRYSGKLYWEALTGEELLEIISREKPVGVLLQFAAQSANAIAPLFKQAGIPIRDQQTTDNAGTLKPDPFDKLPPDLKIIKLPSGEITNLKNALEIGNQIGYPVLIGPQGPKLPMLEEIAFDAEDILDYYQRISKIYPGDQPVILLEKLLEDAIGATVSCITDGVTVIICGVMEQIEEAAINSDDSALALPPYTLGEEILANLKAYSQKLALALKVKGLLNFQYIIKHNAVYLRRLHQPITRLVPVLIKATGIDWIEITVKIMMGQSLKELGYEMDPILQRNIVKEAVFSFDRFPDVDTILGPETRSTGEVMGLANDFGLAFIKSQLAAGEKLPSTGTIFLSIKDEDKRAFIPILKQLVNLSFKVLTTEEIAAFLNRNSIPCQPVKKIGEGRPNILDKIKNGEVQWIFNTPAGRKARHEESLIRSTAVARGIPIITTVTAAQAVVTGIERYLEGKLDITYL